MFLYEIATSRRRLWNGSFSSKIYFHRHRNHIVVIKSDKTSKRLYISELYTYYRNADFPYTNGLLSIYIWKTSLERAYRKRPMLGYLLLFLFDSQWWAHNNNNIVFDSLFRTIYTIVIKISVEVFDSFQNIRLFVRLNCLSGHEKNYRNKYSIVKNTRRRPSLPCTDSVAEFGFRIKNFSHTHTRRGVPFEKHLSRKINSVRSPDVQNNN